ncbi:MAG: hypothetical protein M3444_12250 [Acidobacteriota bacterium]|nr:hypothetical protein [Acidobacteriota bacterium]
MYFIVPEEFLERISNLSDEELLRAIHPHFGSKYIKSRNGLGDLVRAELNKRGYDKERINSVFDEWLPYITDETLKCTKPPVSLDNVPYHSTLFRKNWLATPLTGDLIVTEQVIYFFPHMVGGYQEKGTEHLGLIGAVVDAISEASYINRSKLRWIGLWRDGDSSETLQLRLDAYITELKKTNSCWKASEVAGRSMLVKLFLDDATGRSWLPYPIRLSRAEIKSTSLAKNVLTIFAKDEIHNFRLGRSRRKFIEQVFREGGWIVAT